MGQNAEAGTPSGDSRSILVYALLLRSVGSENKVSMHGLSCLGIRGGIVPREYIMVMTEMFSDTDEKLYYSKSQHPYLLTS